MKPRNGAHGRSFDVSEPNSDLRRVATDWLRGHSRDEFFDAMLPPGLSEVDSGLFLAPDSIPIFVPGEHDGPHSFKEAGDIADVFGVAEDSSRPRPARGDGEGNIDRFAWYGTFRRDGEWGIYIREYGIGAISSGLETLSSTSIPEYERLKTAFHALYLHEYAHFLFDVATLTAEQIVGTDLYVPHRTEVSRQVPGYHGLTEALCNAFAFRYVSARGLRSPLKAFLRRSPVGYSEFPQYRTEPQFTAGVEQVIGEILRGGGGRRAIGTRGLFDDRSLVVNSDIVPVHLVREPRATPWLALITALGQIEETSTFGRKLKKLPEPVRRAWVDDVGPALATDVRTNSFKRLTTGQYSARVHGDYRVILERSPGGWLAVDIAHRREVYR
jgi:hypothetical protein